MPLTNAQRTAVRNGINAETDPAIVAARTPATRNDAVLMDWCNDFSTTDAWMSQASKRDMFEAINITQYVALLAGAQGAWALLIDNAPIDLRRNKIRNGINNIWGASTQAATVLGNLIEKATKAEVYIGGPSATTNGVTALDRNFVGQLTLLDVGQAMNG